MDRYVTKRELAERLGVTARCIDAWVKSGKLPPPIKLGESQQARCRWPATELADLDARLRGTAAA
jgi:predicted DNA-binding transcriptional regulator AlpA